MAGARGEEADAGCVEERISHPLPSRAVSENLGVLLEALREGGGGGGGGGGQDEREIALEERLSLICKALPHRSSSSSSSFSPGTPSANSSTLF